MCTEIKPDECHRGKLIGNTLFEQQIDVQYIDETGVLLDQQEANKRLNKARSFYRPDKRYTAPG
jgi:hypothetical protein